MRIRLLAYCLFAATACLTPPSARPPSAAAPAAPPTPAIDDGKPSPAQEEANARIAKLARVDLLGGAGARAFAAVGEAQKVEVTHVPVSGQPFADALRIVIKQASTHEWAVQLTSKTAAEVHAGDALLATFFVRAEAPQAGGAGETEFVFELAAPPYAKSVSYPVVLTSDWSRVQVRFEAARDYAAGEAQMIFRLGYEPEILQIGGIKVESFGKQIARSDLPSSQSLDKRRANAAAAAAKQAEAKEASAPPKDGGELRIDVAPGEVIRPISPYVYGINAQKLGDSGATLRRMGGNRQTAYNWEINASNAGSDYKHSSDDWPCTVLGYTGCKRQPGAQFIEFAADNKRAAVESLVTIPMVDYVSADKDGAVAEADKAPSRRWKRSFANKPGALSLVPDVTDGDVYQDEFVNLLVHSQGKAAAGGIRFYALDNEPALWSSTHPRVHPDKTRYDEMVTRTEATASAIARLDPTAMILGGVMFGWSEYMSLSDAPDAAEQNTKYGTYIDYFLASMKALATKHKRRLMHVLDVHWYPEARGTKRVTENDTSRATIAARLQAPRSLWDPTYTEKSWIAATWGKPIRLIPWLGERIAERYPGTKLAITEYNFGAGDHISGGLAEADVLGVLGREGVFLANYWGDAAGTGELPPYIAAAFRLYRNYDGKRGAFGDTAVSATPADLEQASVFAATDSKRRGQLTILVINKQQSTSFTGKIAIKDGKQQKAAVYLLDATSAEIRAQPAATIANGELSYKLAPLSATLFVCE